MMDQSELCIPEYSHDHFKHKKNTQDTYLSAIREIQSLYTLQCKL